MVIELKKIIEAVRAESVTGNPGVSVSGVAYDSRKVTPGVLFAAVRGLAADGRLFIPQAIEAGASAVMVDAPLSSDPGVPVITVANIREAMAAAAAEIHGRPADGMVMIGITGTNGKTTTTYLLESILEKAGFRPGVIGTVNARFGGHVFPASNTTPEGPDLQDMLGRMRDAGVTHVVMEVSSHALDLHRVAGCHYDIGIFTNLTQDHLDYHPGFDAYFEAKKLLFTRHLTGTRLPGGPRAVVNTDDEWGRKLAAELQSRAVTFSLNGPADVYASGIAAGRSGLNARVHTPAGDIPVRTAILGEFNLYNLITATAAAVLMGIGPEAISAGLTATNGAPGRLERVGTRDEFLALVDYAHSPDALTRAVTVVRDLAPSRLVSIFGCGGDRDRTKRPLMGEAAARLSDLAIVTSDNPRTEDPAAILEDIEKGIRPLGLKRLEPGGINGSFSKGSYVVEPDRRAAIRLACRLMQPGDILIVAGKGHEDYQILGRTKIHFDDREEIRDALMAEGKF